MILPSPPQITIAYSQTFIRPNASTLEVDTVDSVASLRTRDGNVLLYPTLVSANDISRVGLAHVEKTPHQQKYRPMGFALDPRTVYEMRSQPGYGCAAPRITFVPALDAYVMLYTAHGPEGPRLAVALSRTGYSWARVGVMRFRSALPQGANDGGAFFPDPVISPDGVESLAFYHHPIEDVAVHIAYIPLDVILRNIREICFAHESFRCLVPIVGESLMHVGTPPVRVANSWVSLCSLANSSQPESGRLEKVVDTHSLAAVVHDLRSPHTMPQLVMLEPSTFFGDYALANSARPLTAIERNHDTTTTLTTYAALIGGDIAQFQIEIV